VVNAQVAQPFDHVISDIWSVGVFFRNTMALYDAFCAGLPRRCRSCRCNTPTTRPGNSGCSRGRACARSSITGRGRSRGGSAGPRAARRPPAAAAPELHRRAPLHDLPGRSHRPPEGDRQAAGRQPLHDPAGGARYPSDRWLASQLAKHLRDEAVQVSPPAASPISRTAASTCAQPTRRTTPPCSPRSPGRGASSPGSSTCGAPTRPSRTRNQVSSAPRSWGSSASCSWRRPSAARGCASRGGSTW
jgi:hypothetical protein